MAPGEVLSAGGRIVGLCLDLLADRGALLGLEVREAKVRLAQCLLLACLGAALAVTGLALAVVAVLLAVPPPWRLAVAAGCAALSLLAGGLAFFALRRRVSRLPLAFSQTVAELKKDRECF